MKCVGRAVVFVTAQVFFCTIVTAPQACRATEINAWDIITIESGVRPNTTVNSMYTSIVLDDGGHEHIAFSMIYERDLVLKYAGWTEKGLVIDQVDDFFWPFSPPSIAVDDAGSPHIAYVGRGGRLMYAVKEDTGWNKTEIGQAGRVAYSVSLALDESHHPHIACLNSTSSYDLRYLSWNGSAWRSETVDTSTGSDGYPSLALDAAGNPRISYVDMVSGYLKFAKRIGYAWETSIVDSRGGLGESTSLAIDDDDVAHIAYHNRLSPALKYAKWNVTHWTAVVVDAIDSSSSGASLALDGDGNPNIAYPGEYSGLRYAKSVAGEWESETVDSEYGSGIGPSIRIDTDGFPHISYITFDGILASSRLARGEMNRPPEWIRFWGQDYPIVNEEECYYLEGYDPEDDFFRFTIDWGDGSVDVTNPAKNGQHLFICHTWVAGGNYHVTVTVTDIHGSACPDSESLDVSVYDPAPKPAYEMAWFWLIIALVTVTLIAVALEYRREGRRRSRDEALGERRPPEHERK